MRKRIDCFTDTRSAFARRLEFTLKHYNIKNTELAEKLGVCHGTINAYISGRTYPSFEALMKIQKVLDISLDWLCGLVD